MFSLFCSCCFVCILYLDVLHSNKLIITQDGQDTDDSKQSTADMTKVLRHLSATTNSSKAGYGCERTKSTPANGELEQSIDELRAEIGTEGSPSPSAAARPKSEETKDDDVSA
ncbi:hypothetical protein V2J09_023229 [Rumex salicifolius]